MPEEHGSRHPPGGRTFFRTHHADARPAGTGPYSTPDVPPFRLASSDLLLATVKVFVLYSGADRHGIDGPEAGQAIGQTAGQRQGSAMDKQRGKAKDKQQTNSGLQGRTNSKAGNRTNSRTTGQDKQQTTDLQRPINDPAERRDKQ